MVELNGEASRRARAQKRREGGVSGWVGGFSIYCTLLRGLVKMRSFLLPIKLFQGTWNLMLKGLRVWVGLGELCADQALQNPGWEAEREGWFSYVDEQAARFKY